MRRFAFGIALGAVLAFGAAQAQELKPAVVFDMGGKFDKSFNEGVFNGVEKFKKETGVDYAEFVVTNPAQREQAIRNFARRGHNPILGVGFAQADALKKVAEEFPNLRFALIDMVVDLPNVQSIVFKEHEGSFLVGLLAAKASKTGKVGFIGGMDIPLIRKFQCGYVQGAKFADPKVEIFPNMTGTTPAAWNDPVKGGELAKSQKQRGADVIYAAAGGTGIGVLQTAADEGILSIGVDSNQNHLHAGKVLTSMLKRVDVAAYNVMMAAKNNQWKSGIQVLGLKEQGVGWALDSNNEKLITPDMKALVDKATADIIAGTIKVHDYTSDSKCPVQ